MAITRAQIARQLYRYGGDTMGGPNDKSANNSSDKGGDNFGQFERRQRQNEALKGSGFLGKDQGMNIGEQNRLAKFGDYITGGGTLGAIARAINFNPPSTYTDMSNQGNDSSLPAYLKKPFSDIQYAAPSTSTHAFCPTNPQLVPTCANANVNG